MREAIKNLIAANNGRADEIDSSEMDEASDYKFGRSVGRANQLRRTNHHLQAILDKDAENALRDCEDAL